MTENDSKQAYAGFWRRAVAILLDALILCAAFLILATLVFVLIAIPFGLDDNQSHKLGYLVGYIAPLPMIFVGLFYWPLWESSSRMATPGKLIAKIRVTALDGSRLSFGVALMRNLAKIASGIPLLAGFFMAAFTQRRQGLHDIMVGTIVVKKHVVDLRHAG